MKTLNRLFLLGLVAALVGSAIAIYSGGTTQISLGHDTLYHLKWPWLHNVREVSFFAVLAWCLLFLRREPTAARIGLVAVLLAFALMTLPPRIFKQPIEVPSWH